MLDFLEIHSGATEGGGHKNQREIEKFLDIRGNSLKKWHKVKVNVDATEEKTALYKSWPHGGRCHPEGHRTVPYCGAKGSTKRKYHSLTILLNSTPLRLTDILETFFCHLWVKYTQLSK